MWKPAKAGHSNATQSPLQTSNMVASVLYQLALHKDKQEKLRQEVEGVLCDKSDGVLDNEMLERMSYLKACVKETMRYIIAEVLLCNRY